MTRILPPSTVLSTIGCWNVMAARTPPPKIVSLVSICRRSPAHAPLPHAAVGDVVRHAADPAEFRLIEQGSLVAEQPLHRGRRREHRHGQPVGRGLAVDVIGGAQRSRARHVGRHDQRLARNESAVVTRQYADIGVVAATRRKACNKRERLALVEIGDRIGADRRRCGDRAKRGNARAGNRWSGHCVLLGMLSHTALCRRGQCG